jgi:hypothetical protein
VLCVTRHRHFGVPVPPVHNMTHKPFNKHFWLTLIAIIFAGGLIYGQAVGLNDALDQGAASVANAVVFSPERIELNHIGVELETLLEEPAEDEFIEVDEALGEL